MNKETIETLKKMIEDGNLSQEIAEKYCPELKESEDERIRKALIDIIRVGYSDYAKEFTKQELIAWLEKQDQQKYIPKYKIGDYVKNTNYKGEPIYEIVYMDKECYICEYRGKERMGDKAVMHFSFDNPYLRLVQKPADKVEPKFKDGDWIVYKDNIWKVCNISLQNYYELLKINNEVSTRLIEDVDNNAHLWTIQDAKDGDVLSYREGQWCFIYKGIVTEDTFKYYALLSEKGITVNDAAFSLLTSCITPATKDQRDALMKAMTDAGYTFDFEKKELRKIEQKPTEDVDLPEFESYLCLMFQKFRAKGMCTNGEIIDYVKEHSQKLRDILVNLAWSEEDETKINYLIALLQNCTMNNDALRVMNEGIEDWLKSLRPQTTWKPSDEQMEAFKDIIVFGSVGKERKESLISLYRDLQELWQQD